MIEITITDGTDVWHFQGNIDSIKSTNVEIQKHSELIRESLFKQDLAGEKFKYSLLPQEKSEDLVVCLITCLIFLSFL